MRTKFLAVAVGLWTLVSGALADEPAPAAKGGCVIVTTGRADDPANPLGSAVKELAEHRGAIEILDYTALTLDGVLVRLRELQPRYVAFVLPFEMIEDNLVGAVFGGMTRLDAEGKEDASLDAAWGYITGRTPEDVLLLVRNTIEADREIAKRAAAGKGQVPARKDKFVAIAHTFNGGDLGPFATEQGAEFKKMGFDTAGINPIDDSPKWKAAEQEELRKLNDARLVYIVGHGMGDMSCGVSGGLLGEAQLDRAIVVNGTCHSAVTLTRHDSTDMNWTIATTKIDPDQSVCLNFIKAGAVGQIGSTASSSWMNVALATDDFLHEGQSMGEALMDRLNQAIAESGRPQVLIQMFRDGQPSPQDPQRDDLGGVQSRSRVILIGDPAHVPFPKPD